MVWLEASFQKRRLPAVACGEWNQCLLQAGSNDVCLIYFFLNNACFETLDVIYVQLYLVGTLSFESISLTNRGNSVSRWIVSSDAWTRILSTCLLFIRNSIHVYIGNLKSSANVCPRTIWISTLIIERFALKSSRQFINCYWYHQRSLLTLHLHYPHDVEFSFQIINYQHCIQQLGDL